MCFYRYTSLGDWYLVFVRLAVVLGAYQVLMGDSFNPIPGTKSKSMVTTAITTKNESKQQILSSRSNTFANVRRFDLIKFGKQRRGSGSHLVLFLVKVVALEAVRRISRSKCPFVWSGLQALQVVCYPPLKWMQRWNPFRVLVEGMQVSMLLSNSEELVLNLMDSSRCIRSFWKMLSCLCRLVHQFCIIMKEVYDPISIDIRGIFSAAFQCRLYTKSRETNIRQSRVITYIKIYACKTHSIHLMYN